MTQLDTLYNVSARPPSQADSALVFPGGVMPTSFGANESYGWDVMSGYSSGALIEDQGPFGTLVFGTGGHTRLQNQLLSLTISADAPAFGWFQQPAFETAEVNGAELYFNRAEFDALPVNRKTCDGDGTETAMTQAWLAAGAQFPMGCNGWIFPRKLVTGQLGNNNPHGFRYLAPIFIPSSFTGTSAGAYLVVEAPQGPFAQSWRPEGSQADHLMDPSALWPSGRRKWPIWYKNTQTGAWNRLAVLQPDYAPYGFIRQHTALARDQKRVYVSVDVGNQTASFWYLDFSNGVAGAIVGALFTPTTSVDPNRNTSGAFTDGHPGGRHLWFWPDLNDPQALDVQDLDQRTQYRVHIGQGLSVASQESVGMLYDPVNDRIILLQLRAQAIVYRVINVPADPTNAASYVVSAERTLAIAPSVQQPVEPSHFYSKARLHLGLGVIFIPQNRGPMLAFRPSR